MEKDQLTFDIIGWKKKNLKNKYQSKCQEAFILLLKTLEDILTVK